jgi:VCBS repeat-containing protein
MRHDRGNDMQPRSSIPSGARNVVRPLAALVFAFVALGVVPGSATGAGNKPGVFDSPITAALSTLSENTPPVANDDTESTDEDTDLNANVLTNDTDAESDPLTAIEVTGPANGTLTLGSDGSYTYTPDPDYNGPDSFTYKANDGTDDSNTATVNITVNSVNDAPVANDDTESTDEDTDLNANVLTNDTDVDGDALTAIEVAGPANGTLTLGSDGAYTYTPDPDFNGPDSFTYKANDGTDDSNTATVNITVNSVNDAPVANDDTESTDEDADLNANVLTNDTDADGDALTAIEVAGPANGTLTLNSDGSYTYTPDPDYNGPDSFTYKANDGTDDSNTATVNITVNPVNDAPVANDDTESTDEDTDLNANVLTNDTDADGDALTAIEVTGPANGTLTLGSDGAYTYTPDPDYNGPDSFTYKANDGTADSNTATVNITVNSVNDAPVATDDTESTDEDTDLSANVLTNDTDVDSSLTATNASDPAHGSLTLGSDGSYTYEPDLNYNGPDSFTYTATDGTLSDTATVSITVNSVNDAPVAVDDGLASVPANHTLDRSAMNGVLSNDSDVETDRKDLTAVLVTDPSNGTVDLHEDGSYSYEPDSGFEGLDSFTYKANDGTLDSNTATVSINVHGVNNQPAANDDSATTDEDTPLTVPAPGLLFNDSDGDDDTITPTKLSNPAHGTATVNTDGSYTYTPTADFSGTDSFTYQVSDGDLDSDPATVTITVDPIDDLPTATDDDRAVSEDSGATNLNVRSNDDDVDADPITVTGASDPPHGTSALSGGDVSYTPDPNYCNSSGAASRDTFTYTVNGGDTATVEVTVLCLDDAPVAVDDARTVAQGGPITDIDVLANDPDPDGGPKQVASATQAANGTTALSSSGVTYKPDPLYCNSQPGGTPDTFTYRVNGGSQATVAMTVTCRSPSGQGDDIAPVFASARVTNPTFAVDPGGRAETAVTARAKKGTTFVYSLSEAARVVFTIEQRASGRRVGSKCVRPTKRNATRRACTRYVKIGSFAQDGAAGTNRKAFSGKIGRKTLKPGRYRATLVATDAARNRSKPKLINLNVVRR